MNAILAPIDFSPVSRAVGKEALSLSAALKQRVIFLHVLPPLESELVGEVNLADVMAAGESTARAQLHTFAQEMGATTAEVVVATGFVATEILLHARNTSASHIVLGSRGHSLLHDLLVGSTTRAVLHASVCPVVVVPVAPQTVKAA